MVKVKEETLEDKTKNVYEQMCRMIGTHIYKEREKKGISLREMYRRTNISIAVLSDIENGLKLPRIETLIKLVLKLEIPLSDIFGTISNPDNTIKNMKSYKQFMDEKIKELSFNLDFSKDELKEIAEFVEYIKFKRSKKK